ncbi:MAG: ArsR family transcriptional regulator [Caldilinea sp. CFX5]|nr:ArsR family transcriptional regulator [Caldilinea sp. CFX5]
MHAVRKSILEILKEQRSGATVAELAERLEMAPVSVRHHLDILQGDNLICVERLERKGCVGRPQQVYTLTPEANCYFPNNFAGLADKLMDQIKQILPPDQVPHAFRSIARQIAAEFKAREWGTGQALDDSAAAEIYLDQVTTFLSERGYLARWERDPNGIVGEYLLHKYNCPYAGVSAEHRELCSMDQTLINELFAEPCQRSASMVDGSHCCTYRISSTTRCACASVDVPLLLTVR